MLLDQCWYFQNPNYLQPCAIYQLAKSKREAISKYANLCYLFYAEFHFKAPFLFVTRSLS